MFPMKIPGLVNIQQAIENGPVEIVDLPTKHGDFPSFFACLPGRVWQFCWVDKRRMTEFSPGFDEI